MTLSFLDLEKHLFLLNLGLSLFFSGIQFGELCLHSRHHQHTEVGSNKRILHPDPDDLISKIVGKSLSREGIQPRQHVHTRHGLGEQHNHTKTGAEECSTIAVDCLLTKFLDGPDHRKHPERYTGPDHLDNTIGSCTYTGNVYRYEEENVQDEAGCKLSDDDPFTVRG